MKTQLTFLAVASCLTISVVVESAFAQKAGGLRGDYFNGPNFEKKVLSRTDAQIDFRWDGQSPALGVDREYFSVRWTGKLFAPASGVYKFSALVDDGIRVWVGGKKVIDEWRKQDDTKFVGEIKLNANQSYDLKVEYYNDWKGSAIQLYWELPTDLMERLSFRSEGRKVIDAKYLTAPSPTRKVVSPRPAVAATAPKKTLDKPIAPSRKPVIQAALATNKLVERPTPTPPAPVPTRKPVVEEPAKPPVTPLIKEETIAFKTAEPAVLIPVLFEQSSYVLTAESVADLDQLVSRLKAKPTQRIEVSGHTDNVGDPRLNLALSEYRAKVVATYLERQGIAGERIDKKGYGGSRPIADNAVAAERIRNRRVEILVR